MTQAVDRRTSQASDSSHSSAASSYDYDTGPQRHSPPSASDRGRGRSELSRWLGEGLVRRSSAPPSAAPATQERVEGEAEKQLARVSAQREAEAPTIRSPKNAAAGAVSAPTPEAKESPTARQKAEPEPEPEQGRSPLETLNGVGPLGAEPPRDSIASVTMEQSSDESALDDDDLAVLPGGGRKKRSGAGGFLLAAAVLVLAFVAVSQLSSDRAEEQAAAPPEPAAELAAAAPTIPVNELPPPAPTEALDEVSISEEDPEVDDEESGEAAQQAESPAPKAAGPAKAQRVPATARPKAPQSSSRQPSLVDSSEFVREKPSVGRLPDVPAHDLLRLSDRQVSAE